MGIDWNGPLSADSCDNIVHVDSPRTPLNNTNYQELLATINPLESCNDYGIQLYCETVDFILTKLN